MQQFEKELQGLINRHSVENQWDMPDFIMARLISPDHLPAFMHKKHNLDWHGVDGVCHPKGPMPLEGYDL